MITRKKRKKEKINTTQHNTTEHNTGKKGR